MVGETSSAARNARHQVNDNILLAGAARLFRCWWICCSLKKNHTPIRSSWFSQQQTQLRESGERANHLHPEVAGTDLQRNLQGAPCPVCHSAKPCQLQGTRGGRHAAYSSPNSVQGVSNPDGGACGSDGGEEINAPLPLVRLQCGREGGWGRRRIQAASPVFRGFRALGRHPSSSAKGS